MRRAGVVAGFATVVLVAALTGCEVRPPYPDWCRDLDDWLSDVYPVVDDAGTVISPGKGRDLADALRDHSDAVAQYPELSTAFIALVTSLDEIAPDTEESADWRALEENVWDEWEIVREPCPGPYY